MKHTPLVIALLLAIKDLLSSGPVMLLVLTMQLVVVSVGATETAWAETLTLSGGQLDSDREDGIDVRLFFEVIDETGAPVQKVEAGDLELTLKGKAARLEDKTVRSLTDAEEPIAVLFVFPLARDYTEERWLIRTLIAQNLNGRFRSIDYVGAIGYDSGSWQAAVPHRNRAEELAEKLVGWTESEDPETDLYAALRSGLLVLDNKGLDDVKVKVLVVIADGAGSLVDSPDWNQVLTTEAFREKASALRVTPVIVAYSLDEKEGRSVDVLEKLGAAPGAIFYKADQPARLDAVLGKLLDRVFAHQVLQAVLPLEQGAKGPYELELEFKSRAQDKISLESERITHKLFKDTGDPEGSVISPFQFCSHFKGDVEDDCERELVDVRIVLGEKLWEEFSLCGVGKPKEDIEMCITDEMNEVFRSKLLP